MITPDQIPDAVVEALLAHLNTCECRDCTAETIAAALAAWPGAIQFTPLKPGAVLQIDRRAVVLPLPQESSNG